VKELDLFNQKKRVFLTQSFRYVKVFLIDLLSPRGRYYSI